MTIKSIEISRLGFLALAAALWFGCNRTEPTGAATSGASGPAEPAAPKIVKLAFVTNNASEFWKIAQAGVRKYEAESKVQVDMKMPPNGTTAEQNQILENLASQGYDAIAVSVIAPNDQVPVLDKVAAKTKLITFDSDAPKSKRLLYIGTNNFEAGKALGGGNREAAAQWREDGGVRRHAFGRQRQRTLAGHRGRDRRQEDRDRRQARGQHRPSQGALERRRHRQRAPGPEPRRRALVLQRPGHRRGARSARQEGQGPGGRLRRGGATLKGIQNGTIAATVVQKPFQFGYLSSKWMHELATKRGGDGCDPRRPRSSTRASRSSTRPTSPTSETRLAEMKK